VKVFFYVQHLLGIGHLKRAATLARALVERETLDQTEAYETAGVEPPPADAAEEAKATAGP
jgi:predicted glycosyltransferase